MIIFESHDLRVRRLELGDAELLVKHYEGRDRPHDLELICGIKGLVHI